VIVSFTPVEGDTRTYEFKAKKLLSVEAENIERLVGKPYSEAVQAIIAGSALARRALVYTLEKRTHPTLSWASFDFPYDAVDVEFDAEEMADIRAAIEAAPNIDEQERAAMLAQFDEIEPAPKAPTPSDVSST
jgi:hypothetical protein